MTMSVTGSVAAGQGAIATHAAPPPRLVRAAHEFEAQLMKELLRPMTESGSLMGDDEADTGGAGTLGEFASESLAGALSASGGFGIANRILGEVSRSGNSSKVSPVTGMYNIDTGISAHK
jgi:Rod binding domain-containing protein